ncbi:methyltransferase domain-containing protein [Chelatococcus sp. SYSU_G07232]|uniref:Methyltransferase domain-containing protein n=1 Tax=Chelatococcus albus TaxID=3047466 RepID=A0ABT7ADL5_9HYPH|nr:methyltransferase domain-containing protein [Chelatococcus sp. SYSU_G07232]MDJ1157468.1 methyltransferase domain-containing protein [Chelatococcus sp. SYSU_G07232]
MAVDVVDLRSFYASPLGHVARRFVGRAIEVLWSEARDLSVLGVGYATPYLSLFRGPAERTVAFMPAAQGVVNWPTPGLSASALVEPTMLPLADQCFDRVLLVHALETSDAPEELMSEVWRILNPGGRIIVVAPNRRGLWARMDTTPFGQGQPYSRSQLNSLMRQTLFSPEHWAEALYVPPLQRRLFLRSAAAWERVGAGLSLPFAGVHVIEATKQLYRPIAVRQVRRAAQLRPVLLPSPGTTVVAPRLGRTRYPATPT